MQSGQRVNLPGRQKIAYDEDRKKLEKFLDNNKDFHHSREHLDEEEEDEDDIELVSISLLFIK